MEAENSPQGVRASTIHRVAVEPHAAGVHVEAVQNLRQRLVQAQHDLHLPVWELRHQSDGPKRPNRENLQCEIGAARHMHVGVVGTWGWGWGLKF